MTDYKIMTNQVRDRICDKLRKAGLTLAHHYSSVRIEAENVYYSFSVEVKRDGWGRTWHRVGVRVSYDCRSNSGGRFNRGYRRKTLVKTAFTDAHIEKIAREILEAFNSKVKSAKEQQERERDAAALARLADKELPDPQRWFSERTRREDGTYRIKLDVVCSLEQAQQILYWLEK